MATKIIGHERQRGQLLQDLLRDSLAHAYLFCGKKHLGKFTVARWFAEEVLGNNRGENERGEIRRLLKRNMHPDCLVLDQLWIADVCTDWNVIARSSNVPQQHRAEREAKTDTIGIEDVRALQERLYETPQGGRTLCLIRSIERLHDTAANALLKILEEPPPHVLFLCTTESLSPLPETVVSRMRIMHFSPVRRTVLEALLGGVPEDDRTLILTIAGGAPGVLLDILDDLSRLRAYRQADIAAQRFLGNASLRERLEHLQRAFKEDQRASLLFRHIVLRLQKELRSRDPVGVQASLSALHSLFSALHTLQSNTHRGLLAAQTALHCATHGYRSP